MSPTTERHLPWGMKGGQSGEVRELGESQVWNCSPVLLQVKWRIVAGVPICELCLICVPKRHNCANRLPADDYLTSRSHQRAAGRKSSCCGAIY
jgi:hypothetical protein